MTRTPPDPRADQDPSAVRPLHEAEQLLDAAPSPHVRAAILRAAVAQPRSVRAPVQSTATNRGSSLVQRLSGWFAWRPALPVAVAMAVGIFAVGLSLQFEHDHPAVSGASVPASLPPAHDVPGNSAAPTAPAVQPAAPTDTSAKVAADIAAEPQGATATTAVRKIASTATAPLPAQEAGQLRDADAPAIAPATRPPAAESPMRNEAAAASGTARLAAPAAAEYSARTRAAPVADAAASVAGPQSDSSAWLKRIIALRARHADQAADRELAAFVRAYPGVAVPDAARSR